MGKAWDTSKVAARPMERGITPVDLVSRLGPVIFDGLADDTAEHELNVSFLKQSRGSIVFRAMMGGADVVVKVFADTADGELSYLRELGALDVAQGSGLIPRLRGYSAPARVIVQDHIEGALLSDIVTRRNLLPHCVRIGRWYGAFARVNRTEGTGGNWAEYLSSLPDLQWSAAVADLSHFLHDFDYPALALAKNDAALANFIQTPRGDLIGIDFECAQFKPLGWDILLTARSLSKKWPDQTEAICKTLCAEFCRAGIGQYDHFLALTQSFVIGSLFEPAALEDVHG